MNKKKIFSRTLYMEGIRQLRLIGFIFLIIYVLEAVLIPLNRINNRFSYPHTIVVGINDMHPVIYLTYTVLAPIMVLYLFRFLTNRNSSDFYHSIPHTRTCLYISYITAILSWIFVILFVSSGISICIFSFLPNYSIQFSRVIPYIIGIFIASMGVTGGITVAQCITGTILSNIVVSGIILFFPRLMTFAITQNVLNSTWELIPSEYFMPAINGKYNLITAVFFTSSPALNVFTKYSSWIYTFILAMAYFAAGLWLFNKRHSENAQNAASSRWLQAVYRICITFAFCLIPITIICQDELLEPTGIFTLYCIAAVMYFLFEIVTTKTIRNLLKIIPGLIIIAILNICTIFFINTVSDYELNLCPEPSEVAYINSISLESDGDYIWELPGNTFRYSDILCENIKINDKEIIEAILDALESDIEHLRLGSELASDYMYRESNIFRTFAIHMKNGRTYYRRININQTLPSSSKLYTEINNYLSDNLKYMKQLENLPDYKDTTIDLLNRKASDTQKKYLYNAFLEDYDALSPEDKVKFIEESSSYYYSDNDNSVDKMTVIFSFKGKLCYIDIPVTPELPNTFKAYINYYYDDDSLKELKGIFPDIEKYILDTRQSLVVSIQGKFQTDFIYRYSDGKAECQTTKHQAEVEEILKELSGYIPDTVAEYADILMESDSYVKIVINPLDYDNFIDTNNTIILPVTDEVSELCERLYKLTIG